MRVALTGTPGVGKTSVAAVAARRGWRVVDVKAWAAQEGCVVAFDEADQAAVIDVDALALRMPPPSPAAGERLLFEGHLSHLLPVDQAWVVRCDPAVLRPRLEARGYPEAKVRENLEAEALDILLAEALEHLGEGGSGGGGGRVLQRDGTRRTPEELFQAFAEASPGGPKEDDLEPVDWSDRLPIA